MGWSPSCGVSWVYVLGGTTSSRCLGRPQQVKYVSLVWAISIHALYQIDGTDDMYEYSPKDIGNVGVNEIAEASKQPLHLLVVKSQPLSL